MGKAANFEAMFLMPEKSSASMEMEEPLPTTGKSSASLSVRKKASRDKSLILRRSGRLQNLVQIAHNREIEPIVEHINLVETEREEDEPHVEESGPNPIPTDKSLEDKVDRLVETVEELKSMNTEKATKRHFSSGGPSTIPKYKSLYIESQKKIEALTDANCQLTKKLELALAKLEAYKEVKEVMDKMKDAILISNLTKATEAVANLSSRVLYGGPSSQAVVKKEAKRKKGRKNSKAN